MGGDTLWLLLGWDFQSLLPHTMGVMKSRKQKPREFFATGWEGEYNSARHKNPPNYGPRQDFGYALWLPVHSPSCTLALYMVWLTLSLFLILLLWGLTQVERWSTEKTKCCMSTRQGVQSLGPVKTRVPQPFSTFCRKLRRTISECTKPCFQLNQSWVALVVSNRVFLE